jgi:hypothetical protein
MNNHINFYNVLSKYNRTLNVDETYAKEIPLEMDELKKSILLINVFYKRMSHLRLQESPAITSDSLVSSIGGNMGLFLGMSILTILEIVEFIYNIIHVTFKR